MIFFNAPKFWFRKSNRFLDLLNRVLEKVHGHFNEKPYKSKGKTFVIAVGGVTVGGAGKTPVVIELSKVLKKLGYKTIIGMRGYGRKNESTIFVDNSKHSFADVGDEALLISSYNDVCVSTDRAEIDRIAAESGYECLILDDGFMQKDIKPDLKILVIDGKQPLGNRLFFPLGPLRIEVHKAINNSDLVIFLNEDKFNIFDEISKTAKDKLIRGFVKSEFSNISKNVVAFCGLGCNEKFFESLNSLNVMKTYSFPDHYPYKNSDIYEILRFAKSLDDSFENLVDIVTTEKDYQRLDPIFKDKIKFIPISVELQLKTKL